MNHKIENLIKLADLFDAGGEVEAANEIDEMLQKMAMGPEEMKEELERLKQESAEGLSTPMPGMVDEEEQAKWDEEETSKMMADFESAVDEAENMLIRGNQAHIQLHVTGEVARATQALRAMSEYIKGQLRMQREDVADDPLTPVFATLSEIADGLDKNGATEEANKIDEFLEKYGEKYCATDVEWQEEKDDNDKAKRYDEKFHHEQLVKEPKGLHAQGPNEHHVKEYEVGNVPLQGRHCPDHIGTMLGRIGENTYICPLDNATYNWEAGFTDAQGKQHPGSSVSNQTGSATNYFATPSRIFDHGRDEVLNRIN
jgi:hypothetical protein